VTATRSSRLPLFQPSSSFLRSRRSTRCSFALASSFAYMVWDIVLGMAFEHQLKIDLPSWHAYVSSLSLHRRLHTGYPRHTAPGQCPFPFPFWFIDASNPCLSWHFMAILNFDGYVKRNDIRLVPTGHWYRLAIVAGAISNPRVSRELNRGRLSISFSKPSFFRFTVDWYCTTETEHERARYWSNCCEINTLSYRLWHRDTGNILQW